MFTNPEARRGPGVVVPAGIGWGVALAVGAALISGVAIYLNAFAVKQLPDTALYTTLKNGVAASILLAAALTLGGLREARTLTRRQWLPILAVGVVGGSLPFIMFFTGLAQASAPSAAFVQKTLFVWVALLAVPFLGERLGWVPIAALAALLVGQALILPPDGVRWGTGETLILGATLLWAVETILVKRLLASVSASLMALLRMAVGLIVLFGYLIVSAKLSVLAALSQPQWGWALLTGVVLAGYVATWFGALQRAPASIVTSVLVLGAVMTGALTAVTKGAVPSATVVGGYVLIVYAAAALIAWSIRSARRVARAPVGSVAPVAVGVD
ncbi:MAG TPA: DMT family transporter [Candidatus Limnocylindrales bacterium]|jgi:drug/metabolite transporter (DMT)-like permease|nr:DMT family transporter [Candidatus Limnocylindrales bacterium]